MEAPRRLVTVVIVGCGNRGQKYARYHSLFPELCQVVGVAEPRPGVRKFMQETYKLESANVFSDWRDLVSAGKIADAVVISTQDRDHLEPAIALANLGYHMLLEKPMSTSLEECKAISEAVQANNIIFCVGHVLRYTSYSRKMKEILDSKVIGDVINIQHLEPVGWFHYVHSYVRGNWRNEKEASSILMAKCCHDVDWILWMMDKKPTRVSSFGSLKHFNEASKPEGAGERCLDCAAEPQCAYSAKNIYLDGPTGINSGNDSWPVNVITEDTTVEGVTKALETGPYGRCAYSCDNDVLDNQVVNMQFEDGSTASFTMVAFSEEVCTRKTRIFGTRGEIVGDGEKSIKVFTFVDRQKKEYFPDPPAHPEMNSHGGGDFGLMESFVKAVSTNNPSLVCNVNKTLESHMVVFEAEIARTENRVKDLDW
eukprot:TRINITY_DN4904_c0_g1_i1.p1 TRINITY_DN4904_c0_g1~~TRINITY_DN4904_c0_g1_i1.p1  ORF type:complete len:425 (-),score=102.06 TRINITY_DN4904_c0_g1_i1:125-1399(-)